MSVAIALLSVSLSGFEGHHGEARFIRLAVAFSA